MKNFLFAPLIFIGDTHGFLDDFKKQEEVIKEVKPDHVLLEQLEDNTLDSPEAFKFFKENRLKDFPRLNKIINLCEKESVNLIGIDFKNFGLTRHLQEIINKKLIPSIEDNENFDKIIMRRERLHIKKINEYKTKTNKPLVIILGAWHLREDSLIRKYFNRFKIIYPSDKSGKLVIEPTDEEIIYNEYIKT